MKGNGMGPENKGPGTGRKMGFCYGWGKSGFMNENSIGVPRRLNGQYGNRLRDLYHNNSEHDN